MKYNLNWLGVKCASYFIQSNRHRSHLPHVRPVFSQPCWSDPICLWENRVWMCLWGSTAGHTVLRLSVFRRTEWTQQVQNSWWEDGETTPNSIFICHSHALYLISASIFTSRFNYALARSFVVSTQCEFQSSFVTFVFSCSTSAPFSLVMLTAHLKPSNVLLNYRIIRFLHYLKEWTQN